MGGKSFSEIWNMGSETWNELGFWKTWGGFFELQNWWEFFYNDDLSAKRQKRFFVVCSGTFNIQLSRGYKLFKYCWILGLPQFTLFWSNVRSSLCNLAYSSCKKFLVFYLEQNLQFNFKVHFKYSFSSNFSNSLLRYRFLQICTCVQSKL